MVCTHVNAQVHDKSWHSITLKKEGSWFASQEAKDIAENVLLYQRDIGGWPKNIQMQEPLTSKQRQDLIALKSSTQDVTTDNGATVQEMIFLSKIYRQIPDERYKTAFLKGVDYLLEAQYDNGGWPQFYPLKKGYYTHITYNDDSMFNILSLFKNLKENTGAYSIKPTQETIDKIKLAFDKGIDCILKTQYKQDGVLTAWCAQHDENTFEPAKARAYELPSLSGAESANIVLLLMSIENPSEAIKKSIESAVNWFDKVKITGIRELRQFNEKGRIIDKKIVKDDTAPPIWARFMELDDNKPFFCDRDGIKKYSLDEIGPERRNGYKWYTDAPSKVLEEYKKWVEKYGMVSSENNTLKSPKDDYNMVVAKDGTGDFTSIQEAINSAKAFPYQRVIINIKNGTYKEKVHVYAWNTQVSLIGESKAKTIITFDDYFDKIDLGRNSTFHTSTLLVEGNDFVGKNLTVENSSGEVGQAVALSVNATRCYFENCSFLGFQDTVYTAGEGFKQYFKNCYIEGSTDFIFGEATVLFDTCEIHSKTNSFITAASTPQNQEFGYIFKNCKLTADEDVADVYLGRPWRIYAKTVFMDCDMGSHIRPEGWNNWSNKEAESTTFYAEYNNKGAGYRPQSRVGWSHQLTKREAKKYTTENILKSNSKNTYKNWY
ncbi:hypothetical protein GCM10007962_00700 [Yeosuana aromativorans]|uniref:Pectinesterase n=1 Tax=Yeosuana aromativorans TaxID=288019 RepID=A0A8J3FEW8_9FLAO|nr:pectate lyase [Yeosuana aromativorans]GGK10407.1 hypothetical protein GCM10007962_00700 [Yeosuana aromativorans]